MRRSDRFAAIEWKLGEGEHARRVHAHSEWSVGIVRSGSTSVRVGTESARLERGGFLAVPPGTPHLCAPDPYSGFSYSTLYVGTERTRGLPILGRALVGEVDERAAESLCARIVASGDESELREALAALAATLDSGSRSRLGRVPAMRLDGTETEDHADGSDRYRRYRARLRACGAGSRAVFQTRRIEAAKTLLRSGSSIVETAMECGYYDQSHFDRLFRLYTGLTPSAYRAQSY